MGVFVRNTFTKVEDVRSKYREIEEYDLTDVTDNFIDDMLIYKIDYNNRISQIEDDVNKIIKMLKSYDTSGAIDELEILAEKLY